MHLRSLLAWSTPLCLLLVGCPADDSDSGASGGGTESTTTSTSATTATNDPCAGLACGDMCFACGADADADAGADCEGEVCDAGGMCVGMSNFDPASCASPTTTSPTTGVTETESGTTGVEDYCAGMACGDLCFPPCPDDSSCEQTVCDAAGACIGESSFDPTSCGGGSASSGSGSGSSSGSTSTAGSESGSGSTSTGGSESR